MKPESPRFKAVRSLLLSTQMVAVALPGKRALLRLNFKMLRGHRVFPWKELSEMLLPFLFLF